MLTSSFDDCKFVFRICISQAQKWGKEVQDWAAEGLEKKRAKERALLDTGGGEAQEGNDNSGGDGLIEAQGGNEASEGDDVVGDAVQVSQRRPEDDEA